jgi:proteic killer suppression protein
MDFYFTDNELERLWKDRTFTARWSPAIVRAFRLRVQSIQSAEDERDLYAFSSFRFEKLSGKRQYQHSLRLNDQYRLILEFEGAGRNKIVRIVGIEDYH